MENISINGTAISATHKVVLDDKTKHTHIHVTVKVEDLEITHVHTVGLADKPLPSNYGKDELQRDLDQFKQECAAMLESKARSRRLASQLS